MTDIPDIGDVLYDTEVSKPAVAHAPAPRSKLSRKVVSTPVLKVNTGFRLGLSASDADEPAAPKVPKAPPMEEVEYPAEYFSTDVVPQKWLDDILETALILDASDLLLTTENKGDSLLAAVRVDGRMRPLRRVDGGAAHNIMGIFKAANKLSTGGSFRPEEAIHMVPMGDGEKRKGRVALFRKADGGDAMVMRLPPKGEPKRLEDLQFSQLNYDLVTGLLAQSNRMLIFAGPMGSGKTTTAHGSLLHVGRGTRTIWTVEDPVERNLPGLIQLEVDDANGAGFDALLPALVRADYDTLFLGEIRDKATAAAGVRQAKAGRQVITTIHANDNVTAILRLIELAEDTPLSVMDSVRGIISQRLIGKLNPNWNGHSKIDKYKGRVPIHEVLIMSDELTEAVMSNAPLSQVKHIAAKNSQSTFRNDAARLIREGITDEEEVRRVLGE